jgi:7-carboxy-7-deazaguanine synthase
MVLRVNEIYASFQGEGPNVGAPTLFVRFVGCNLKCPGWPCDTQHAIDPAIYRHEMEKFNVDEFVQRVVSSWHPGMNICFTGGEVTLQPIDELERALSRITAHTGADLELFTNGTLRWSQGFRGLFKTITLDWKLPGAGELFTFGQMKHVEENIKQLHAGDAIKFTVKDDYDFAEAVKRYRQLHHENPTWIGMPEIYCGPVWGCATAEEVAAMIMDEALPWFLNVQTHKYIWNPDQRRT